MSDGATGREGSTPAESREDSAGSQDDPPSESPDGDAPDVPGPDWTPEALRRLRADPDRRRAALVAAALVGIGAAWLHWIGLFVAGALVGLVSRDLPRAVAAGLGVGVLVLAVQVLATPVAPGTLLGLTPPAYVAVAGALVGPVWGSLVRGVL